MLNLSFAGTVGRDPETRMTGAGQAVTEFSVAVNGYDRRAKEKTTTWLKVVIWGARGEQLSKLIAKGSRVAGSGTFEVQTYTNRDGEEKLSYVVTVQDVTVQTFAEKEETAPPRAAKKPAKPAQAEDDDIPF